MLLFDSSIITSWCFELIAFLFSEKMIMPKMVTRAIAIMFYVMRKFIYNNISFRTLHWLCQYKTNIWPMRVKKGKYNYTQFMLCIDTRLIGIHQVQLRSTQDAGTQYATFVIWHLWPSLRALSSLEHSANVWDKTRQQIPFELYSICENFFFRKSNILLYLLETL